MIEKTKICIIGLGYVGMPLAVEFGKKFQTIGYDIDVNRISQIKKFNDTNDQLSKLEIKKSHKLIVTNNIKSIRDCNFYIVTVPTPVKKNHSPNLQPLKNACKLISKVIQINDIVVFESTVYPGLTEEICIPFIEKHSKIKSINTHSPKNVKGFYYGYSPERINPGDRKKTLTNIVKLTSGSTPKILQKIDKIYKKIIPNTFPVNSVKIAETAKVIENSQRDINIAFMNELSILCNKLDIPTSEVLEASRTKWNFLDFKPGLVGGHCISVDPYYLAFKAKKIGINTRVILSGRKINDRMSDYVSNKIIKFLIKNKKIDNKKIKILILGAAFKENCPDLRNSQIHNIYKKISKKKYNIDIYDPLVSKTDFEKIYGFEPIKKINKNFYDLVIIAVPHKKILNFGINYIISLCKDESKFIFDLKSSFKSKYIKFSL